MDLTDFLLDECCNCTDETIAEEEEEKPKKKGGNKKASDDSTTQEQNDTENQVQMQAGPKPVPLPAPAAQMPDSERQRQEEDRQLALAEEKLGNDEQSQPDQDSHEEEGSEEDTREKFTANKVHFKEAAAVESGNQGQNETQPNTPQKMGRAFLESGTQDSPSAQTKSPRQSSRLASRKDDSFTIQLPGSKSKKRLLSASATGKPEGKTAETANVRRSKEADQVASPAPAVAMNQGKHTDTRVCLI